MGTVPTPATQAAGAIIPAANLNSYRDTLSFLLNAPKCSASNSVAVSLTTGTDTLITLGGELFDVVQSGDTPSHDTTTNSSRIYARTAGKYRISGQLTFATNATGLRFAQVRLNAAGVATGGTQLNAQSQQAVSTAGSNTTVPIPAFLYPMAAGDYIEMFGFQSSGGALNTVVGGAFTYLQIEWAGQ